MSNIDYDLSMQSHDANGTKSITVSSTDAAEIQQLMSLAGILVGTHNQQQAAMQVAGPAVQVYTDDGQVRTIDSTCNDADDNDDNAVCADCGNLMSQCECGDSEYCGGCGAPIEHCVCDDPDGDDDTAASAGDNAMPTHSFSMEAQAQFDHGQVVISDDGEEVDPGTYMWKPTAGKQRMVKGTMGDNPLVSEAEADKLAKKMLAEYNAFLGETQSAKEEKNEDGQLSPLSMADRTNFESDPMASDESVSDGTYSPMTKIVRQRLYK